MAIKNRKRLSTSLSYEHFEFLTEVCDKNKQKQSIIIEMGLELLKRELENKNLYEIMESLETDKN
ncbi:hypothetical protein [Clostridium chauvoei]|uniref:Uncharacterized protein n=2 Tax=Clostridium chauvoei TaxID=46867 RepID=S6EKU0_9CLOT|nr:hypothetical protein [Clostridium chauvoei]ATD55178.1 hypothetical protein BTM20_07965 [Clostridium chauvoei]ATD57150.1 hypothetical protein BTM21_05080 [Clostridium chauvoei]MBX7279520.1 hypothetical protein [Clostridium chauvoei]MBX7281889.1 hypothetical protein [Clostridium chauvoei]MBX7284522.1 hypothetical protein [Clostridium chauvoei]